MHPINRALTYIEANLGQDISVDQIADYSNISRFHLSRVFSHATGHPLARYVRLRRLTEAARYLRQSHDSVLNIALRVGYDSHAAFTRAFTAEFGVAPSDFRENGTADAPPLVHPVLWSETRKIAVPTPRIEEGLDITLVGYQEHFNDGTDRAPPGVFDLAHKFAKDIEKLPHRTGPGLFQHVFDIDADLNFAYEVLMAVAVSGDGPVPQGMIQERVCWDRYAIFPFEIAANQINPAGFAIAIDWFPQSGFEVAENGFFQVHPSDVWAPPEEARPVPDPTSIIPMEFWIAIK